MGDRIEGDGSLTDPATIRALKWAALNWATHCSFAPSASSPPRQQSFVFPDSIRVDSARPELEKRERQKLRRSSRRRRESASGVCRNGAERREFCRVQNRGEEGGSGCAAAPGRF